MRSRYNYDEDKDLVKKAQNGDKEAFKMLIVKYQQKIFNFCYNILRGASLELYEDAIDVTHDTIFKALAKIDQFKGKSTYKTYLFTIAKNGCYDLIREMKKTIGIIDVVRKRSGEDSSSEDDFPDTNPISKVEKDQINKISVQKCIEQLSIVHREVINFIAFEDFSYQEVSDIIGESIGTVKSRRQRAIEKLQECLKNKGLLK